MPSQRQFQRTETSGMVSKVNSVEKRKSTVSCDSGQDEKVKSTNSPGKSEKSPSPLKTSALSTKEDMIRGYIPHNREPIMTRGSKNISYCTNS